MFDPLGRGKPERAGVLARFSIRTKSLCRNDYPF
jgi:hypothetical protein